MDTNKGQPKFVALGPVYQGERVQFLTALDAMGDVWTKPVGAGCREDSWRKMNMEKIP